MKLLDELDDGKDNKTLSDEDKENGKKDQIKTPDTKEKKRKRCMPG